MAGVERSEPNVYQGWQRGFKGHSNDVWSVAFAPDGRRAASGDQDGVIILWGAE